MYKVRLQASQFQQSRRGKGPCGEQLRSNRWQAMNRNIINHLPAQQSLFMTGKDIDIISAVVQTRSELLQLPFCSPQVRQISLNDHCDTRHESSQQKGYGNIPVSLNSFSKSRPALESERRLWIPVQGAVY